MAELRLFQPTGLPARPRRFGPRLLCYLAFSVLAWLWPPWGALAALGAVLILAREIPWGAWAQALGPLWLFVLAPAAVAFLPPAAPEPGPALARSLTFLVLLAASHWLSATSTVFEIRASLEVMFRILGKRAAGALSLAGALALGFLPWILEQAEAVRLAGTLRGVPRRRPLLALRALSLPLFVRMIEKARHTAEALELRGH